ncbi:hypothetical protein NQ315_014956 [Exocentrus adspersus]|uniref:DDE Tnp4 domain-containing protein n=1 Tax=Exocentrus adspersus TaxID=1586481 RepID=A0AAV8V9Q3_9CUCU|nr:hypothetical protein NQ315_014956 [Exocentrus adspersus]
MKQNGKDATNKTINGKLKRNKICEKPPAIRTKFGLFILEEFIIEARRRATLNLELNGIGNGMETVADAHIFRNSHLCTVFENGRFGDSLLVGDSGYPIKNYLITPLLQTRNEAENLFNESLIRIRNVVERSYGLWKRRFPALALGLRLKVQTTLNVIVASAVLRNIACNYHENLL